METLPSSFHFTGSETSTSTSVLPAVSVSTPPFPSPESTAPPDSAGSGTVTFPSADACRSTWAAEISSITWPMNCASVSWEDANSMLMTAHLALERLYAFALV